MKPLTLLKLANELGDRLLGPLIAGLVDRAGAVEGHIS